MTIDELLEAAGLTANDEIPIWDAEATGESTKKITAQNFANAVAVLADLVTGVKGNSESSYRHGNVNLTPGNIGAIATSDIANDLTITAAGKVLDARQGKVLNDMIDNVALTPSTTIPIPASGNSASYSMSGLTSDHELVRWNFSASAENAPPANLSWDTYNGYFTITNNGGTTSESIRPVFELPSAITITNH